MICPYDDAVEDRMFMFYNSLSEKDKRRYAAIEVLKLPYGGRSYIHNILNCSYPTIDAGIEDLKRDEIFEFELMLVQPAHLNGMWIHLKTKR